MRAGVSHELVFFPDNVRDLKDQGLLYVFLQSSELWS